MCKSTVTVSVTLPLRDYAAFEDLAAELGVKVQAIQLDTPQVNNKGKANPRSVTKHAVTREAYDKIKKALEAHPDASNRLIKEMYNFAHSENTIWRIRVGKIKRPAK